jgi:hypothetical protein
MLEWIEWIGVIPLLGLTGNWRGYRMGGKAIGDHKMSTDLKKKCEAARASGNMDQAKAIADKAQAAKDKRKAGVGGEPKMVVNPETGEMSFDYTGMSKAQIKAFESKMSAAQASSDKAMKEWEGSQTTKMGQMNFSEASEYAKQQLKKLDPDRIAAMDRDTARAMGQFIDTQNATIGRLADEMGVKVPRIDLSAEAARSLKQSQGKALKGDAPAKTPVSKMGMTELLKQKADALKKLESLKQSDAELFGQFAKVVRAGDAAIKAIVEPDSSTGLGGGKAQKQIKGG